MLKIKRIPKYKKFSLIAKQIYKIPLLTKYLERSSRQIWSKCNEKASKAEKFINMHIEYAFEYWK